MGGPPLPNLGDEITMSVVIGGGGGGGGGAEARGGAGGGHGGGGAVDSEEARLRALQKTAIALRSAVPKKSIFEGKKGKMRRRASELKASEAESAAQQAQHNFSTGGGGGVRAYQDGVGAAAAQQEGAGDFTRLQQRIGGLAAGLADGGSTDYAPPAAPTPTVPPPMNMARLSLSPMDQTSIPAAPMLLDQTSVQKVRETLQLKTSNVAKYKIGARVNGLGLKKQHSGTVISTVADAAGRTNGPGVVTIELDA